MVSVVLELAGPGRPLWQVLTGGTPGWCTTGCVRASLASSDQWRSLPERAVSGKSAAPHGHPDAW